MDHNISIDESRTRGVVASSRENGDRFGQVRKVSNWIIVGVFLFFLVYSISLDSQKIQDDDSKYKELIDRIALISRQAARVFPVSGRIISEKDTGPNEWPITSARTPTLFQMLKNSTLY